jgi:glutaredoxin
VSPRGRAATWLLAIALVVLAVVSGCKKDAGDDGDSSGTKPTSGDLPALELRDDTANLLLTWIDEKGDFHVVQKPSDVPEKARGEVRVVVTTREEGTGKLVYVADLSKKKPDGTYPVTVLTRAAWDEKGASRRKARLEALAPPTASVPAGPSASGGPAGSAIPAGKLVAIIYGAEWCKPCHDAEAYLKQRGVVVIHKDIDEDPGARQEMQKKLARAQMPGASIPVIDVMGQILVGFSPRALERALEQARNAQTL